LEEGNWVLPQVYADEFAYKPPMAHWLMALLSYPQGEVTEFSSRLPSALAFIVLVSSVLIFFGRRIIRFQEAFIAALLLITSIEIHRAGMTTRVDMLLTTWIVLGLFQLYQWEDELELKGLPIGIPLLLGCAVLTKGPVGIVLPLFVFGSYLLMLRTYKMRTIVKALFYAAVSSLFLPSLWYIAAWQQGGSDFLKVVMVENFGRFFHFNLPDVQYELGHEKGFLYNILTLISGFMPWTLFLLFSLPKRWKRQAVEGVRTLFRQGMKSVQGLDKIQLFCLVASLCVFLFYSVPSSKRSVYLMPAYPFLSLFIARYMLYVTEYRPQVTRFFGAFLSATITVVWIACTMTWAGWIHPTQILSQYTQEASVLAECQLVTAQLTSPDGVTVGILLITLVALLTLFYQLFKKIHLKILYATFFLAFSTHLLVDGIAMRAIRNGSSDRAFAEEIEQTFPLDNQKIYVMNNLKLYRNLYGMNFYLGNSFYNFEKEAPEEGYFLCAQSDLGQIARHYEGQYTFETKLTSSHPSGELKEPLVFCWFQKHQ
ncbi:MAG: ArnT family glycosyltransferase, partial [Parabacteroides sp.]